MPNVTITAPATARFDGDFQTVADPNHTPSAEEAEFLTAVSVALNRLAQDEEADKPAPPPERLPISPLPQELLAARKVARKTAAAAIKTQVQKFADGQVQAAAATERVREEEKKYIDSVPKFGVMDRSPPRFVADFHIVHATGSVPDSEQTIYLDNLEKAFVEFVSDANNDSNYSPGVIGHREMHRADAVKALRAQAEKFCAGQLSANAAVENLLLIRGGYKAMRTRLTRHLFNVKIAKEDKKEENDDSWSTLDIRLISGLPPPEDTASQEKQDLFIQINRAMTVIGTVCSRMDERAEGGWRSKLKVPDKVAKARARNLVNEYMNKLEGIATIGLEHPYTPLAKLALAELRNEFFSREAGRIKNKYVRWLGAWAGVAALAFLAGYVAIVIRYPDWAWGQTHKAFLVAACGASIGTWASFSVRQVQFSFDDLVMLEENSLDPPLRIVFVVALTLMACLLFWTGAINIEIGNLKTHQEYFSNSGSVALLIGMFAGLSERALATAISGRAAAFVKGIAGAT